MSDEAMDSEIVRLRGENELLRQELLRLFLEEQELLHIVRPNLIRLYQITIGAWELRLLEADAGVRRLRRKIELVGSRLRTGEAVRPDEIDRQLDAEFAEWQQRIRTQAEAVAAAKRNLENLMSDGDAEEFRKLYRSLVEKLHPDLAGEQGPQAELFWGRLQDAYLRHDAGELRALTLLAKGIFAPEKPADSVPMLLAEQGRLKSHIEKSMQKFASMKARPPFTLEKSLGDSAWVEQRRNELDAEVAMLDAQAAGLEVRFSQLLPVIGRVHGFGPN